MNVHGVITKLKSVEASLLKRGEYIERFDALSLSTISSPEELEATGNGNNASAHPQMSGLGKLVHALSLVLNEANVDQQSYLLTLKTELEQFTQSLASFPKAGEFMHGDYYLDGTSENAISISSSSSSTSSSSSSSSSSSLQPSSNSSNLYAWDRIPSAEDDFPYTGGSKSKDPAEASKRRAESIAFKHLQRRIHDVYDSCSLLLDAKLCAHEVIDSTMEGYVRIISLMAHEANISYATTRAITVVKPHANNLLAHRFLDTKEVQELLDTIRQLWASLFFHGNRQIAEASLQKSRAIPHRSSGTSSTYFKMGVGATLLLWSFSECFNNEQIGREIWRDPTFAIFMCFGDLLLLLWMWGVSISVWQNAGVDYIRLLNLEGTELERSSTPERIVYSSATDLSLIFLFVFICFNKARRGVFSFNGSLVVAHTLPTCLVAFILYRFINPLDTRKRWLTMLWQVLAAPFYPICFRDGYIGDLLTSLVRVLIPLCFSFAYLIMSALAWISNDIKALASTSSTWWQDSVVFRLVIVPIVTLAPLWIRLMQCLRRCVETGKRWPHLGNALKYTSAIAVISFGTFQPRIRTNPTWISAFVFATLFQFTWDLTMDWGIVVLSSSKGASSSLTACGVALRQTRLLGPVWIYLTVICSNLLLRFAWAATLLPVDPNADNSTLYAIVMEHLGPLVAMGEILRRMVWGFFRLEHEQLEVIGSPIITTDSIPPLSASLDKMDVMESTKKTNIPVGHSGLGSAVSSEYDWIVSLLPRSASAFLLTNCQLDLNVTPQSKARFVECVIFTLWVIIIISLAAFPALFS